MYTYRRHTNETYTHQLCMDHKGLNRRRRRRRELPLKTDAASDLASNLLMPPAMLDCTIL